MTTPIILASQSTILNKLWQVTLENAARIEVAKELGSLQKKLKMLEKQCNVIVILDLNMLNPDIYQGIRDILTAAPDARILAVSDTESVKEIAAMFSAGVKGFCYKDLKPQLLRKAVQKITDSEIWMERRLTGSILSELSSQYSTEKKDDQIEWHPCLSKLTTRELEIATLVGNGLCQKSITNKLVISEHTVRNHLSNIFRKTGVSSRLQLALMVRGRVLPLAGSS